MKSTLLTITLVLGFASPSFACSPDNYSMAAESMKTTLAQAQLSDPQNLLAQALEPHECLDDVGLVQSPEIFRQVKSKEGVQIRGVRVYAPAAQVMAAMQGAPLNVGQVNMKLT